MNLSVALTVWRNFLTRRRWKRALVILLIIAATTLGAIFLAVEYRPGWYLPLELTEAQLQRARMDATRVVDEIGDRLARRESFEIVLSPEQLNQWLSGLPHIWPEAARQFPPELLQPVIALTQGGVKAAARVESGGWRAILHTQCALEVSADPEWFLVRLASVRLGALPVPQSAIKSMLRPFEDELDGQSVDQLFEGLRFRNRFVWPNGQRRFRISALNIAAHQVRLRMEPL